MSPSPLPLDSPVIIGFGVTGKAVAAALVSRGHHPVVVEDRPGDRTEAEAVELGVTLVAKPDDAELSATMASASALLPSPGVPDHHGSFAAAEAVGVPVYSEFDLAAQWDKRPILAITGTNGKTTVTMMVADALERSSIKAAAVGNTDVPLVSAIDDPTTEVFVVEASSFRLGHSQHFSPQVGAWLNFAPDHLDAHRSLEAYESAKASMWSHLEPGSVAVANMDDPVVVRHSVSISQLGVTRQGFSITEPTDWWADLNSGVTADTELIGPDGPFLVAGSLKRRQPHDVANALAVAAIASAGGASSSGIADSLTNFAGLPHRLELVGSADGVDWYNDSKATVPQATAVAVAGFDSVVLIAGGRNKGLDLDPLRTTVPPVKAVVAIGEAAADIASIYDPLVPVDQVESMDEAVAAARRLADSGDVVVLSPACTSFDWYKNYAERGQDFTALVTQKVLAS